MADLDHQRKAAVVGVAVAGIVASFYAPIAPIVAIGVGTGLAYSNATSDDFLKNFSEATAYIGTGVGLAISGLVGLHAEGPALLVTWIGTGAATCYTIRAFYNKAINHASSWAGAGAGFAAMGLTNLFTNGATKPLLAATATGLIYCYGLRSFIRRIRLMQTRRGATPQ